MLNDQLLQKRMDQFLGYGNLSGKYWVIGMEEGGGNTHQEINQRLNRWVELGCTPVIDNYEFHRAIDGDFMFSGKTKKQNLSCFFEGDVKLQKTWAALIRTILNIESEKEFIPDDIKKYQAKFWGRANSNNCLIEIFPLPSPDANCWYYDDWSCLESLESRETYISKLKEKRINLIRGKLEKHSPEFVFFYSLNKDYIKFWQDISGVTFDESNKVQIHNKFYAHIAEKNGTKYILTGQPSYVRSHSYWNRLGRMLCVET